MRGMVCFLLLSLCGPLAEPVAHSLATTRAQTPVRGTLPNGQVLTGDLTSGPNGLHFTSREQKLAIPLPLMKQVLFDSPTATPASLPLRQIVLTTGESLHVGLEAFGASAVQFRFRNGAAGTVPREAVAQVAQREGERQLVFEDFHTPHPGWKTAPEGRSQSVALVLSAASTQEWPLPTPLKQGVASCWFRVPQPAASEWGVDLQLSPEASGLKVRVVLGGPDESYRVDETSAIRFAQQRLKKTNAEHALLITWSGNGTRIALDNQLLANGPALPSGVHAVRLWRAANDEAPVYVDSVYIAETGVAHTKPSNPLSIEGLQMLSGNDLFGKILELNRQQVAWETPFGKRELPWQPIHRVCLMPAPLAGRPVTGLMSRLEFTPLAGEPMAADVLHAAVTQCDAHQVTAEHPYLGRLQIPTRELHSLRPEFSGTTWLMDPGPRHLGDEVRNDFRAPLPVGSSWQATLKLDVVPAGSVTFRADAVDLEPTGSKAPDGPFRDELRQRFLLTELFVNGQRIDDLNRVLNSRAVPGVPARIQIPIPNRWLKVGGNEIRLVQKSRRTEPGDFDDCELSHMAIESRGP